MFLGWAALLSVWLLIFKFDILPPTLKFNLLPPQLAGLQAPQLAGQKIADLTPLWAEKTDLASCWPELTDLTACWTRN
jgi:hypothetical protein